MIFNNFTLNSIAPNHHRLDDHFETESYRCDDVSYVSYKEETMKRIVPKGSCLWKQDTDEARQNMYRMIYTAQYLNVNNSKVIEKVTICQPDLFECRLSLIKLMSALISENVIPHWYHIKNTLVTERVIYLRDVCVYRDFLWNPDNTLSFMNKDKFNATDDDVTGSYDRQDHSLLHEFSALVHNNKDGRMLPTLNERPSGPKISGWPEAVPGANWYPFWPHIKDDIVFSLKRLGLFDFNPTSAIKIVEFLDQPFVSKERKNELQWLDGDAVVNCSFCEQDRCVWTMNHDKITNNVDSMVGEFPHLYTNSDRRYDGGRLAIYIMNSGDGRRWDKTSVPQCVQNKLRIIWP